MLVLKLEQEQELELREKLQHKRKLIKTNSKEVCEGQLREESLINKTENT